MFREKNALVPIKDIRSIPIRPEYRKFVSKDIKKTDETSFTIKRDVFEDLKLKEMEVEMNEVFLKTVNTKKIRMCIEESHKLWKECLKKAKGNIEKARQLYDHT